MAEPIISQTQKDDVEKLGMALQELRKFVDAEDWDGMFDAAAYLQMISSKLCKSLMA